MSSARDPRVGSDLHVAWTQFQRRQDAMAPIVGFRCVYLPRSARRGLPATALDYLRLSRRTWRLLREQRPRVLWLQLPPVALLWVALAARRFLWPDMKLVADCHNAMFRSPWSRIPAGLSWLRRCDLVVVHNQAVMRDAVALGVPEAKLAVLEDVPPVNAATAAQVAAPSALSDRARPWVVFPGSFARDEPIAELLAAAWEIADVTVVITGRIANAARHRHDIARLPANVVLTDFIPVAEFDALLAHCDVVLALTKQEGIQLSVCNEALGFGKPLVLSDTRILRHLFGAAAVLVDSRSPTGLAVGIRTALAQAPTLQRASRMLAAERRRTWVEVALPRAMSRMECGSRSTRP